MEPPNATNSSLLPPPPPALTLKWDVWLLVACATLGLPANAFTLWLTGWRLRGRGLATFIFGLAASDLLFLANSLLQIWSAAHGHSWQLGTPLCRLHQFLFCLGYYSGLFLLATISLDRCLLVAAPLWYRCRRPARLPAMACAGAGAAAVAASVPEAVLSVVEEVAPGWPVCRTERGDWEVPMRWLEVLVEGLAPFAVVVTCHGVALALASCRRGHGGHPPLRFQRIVVATLSLYVVLHLPFQVVQLLQLVTPWTLWFLFYLLGLAFNVTSCLNPCLYLLLGTRLCQRLARRPPADSGTVVLAAAAAGPGPAAAAALLPAATNTAGPPAATSPVPAAATTPVPPAATSLV